MPSINDIRTVGSGGKAARLWRSLYPPRLAPGEEESEADAAIRAAWVEWCLARLRVRVRRLGKAMDDADVHVERYCADNCLLYTAEGRMEVARAVMADYMDGDTAAAVASIAVPEKVAELLSSRVWMKNPPAAAGARFRTEAAPGDGAGPSAPAVPRSAASTPRAGGGTGPSKGDSENAGLRSECPICFKDDRTRIKVMVLPCRHILCSVCAKDIMARQGLCPMCRSPGGITGLVWPKACMRD